VLVAAVLSLVLTGCGSTVQMRSTVSPGGELSAPGPGGTDALGPPTGPAASGVPTSQPGSSAPGTVGSAPISGPAASPGSTPEATVPPSTQAKTGPLLLGVLDASSPAAAANATGANNPAGVDPVAITRGFIRHYNKRGGVAGRRIIPVEYTINPTSSSYETDLSAACAKFTQDNRVKLVVSQTGNLFSGNYENCLHKAGVTNLEVANGAPDEQDVRSYPRLFTIASPTVDRRITALLRGLTQAKLLTRSNKLGVIVEDCQQNTRAFTRTLAPLAKTLGITVMRRDVSCITGFSDAGAYLAQVGSAVLPFSTAGVDRVAFLTSFEIAALQGLENQAQAQGYKPFYALSSLAAAAANAGQYPPEAQSRMFGVGWIPIVDVTAAPRPGAAKRCDAVAGAEGISPQTQADYAFLYQICDLFAVLDAGLRAARGHEDAIPAGLAAAMPSFESAYVLGGRLRLNQTRHDAPPVFSVFAYQQACTCFRYRATPTGLA
jgi:hypothetical protein